MGTYGVTRGRYPMAGLRPWQRSLCSASLLLLRIPCPPSPSPPPLCGIAVESARRRFYLGEKEPQASGARAGDSYSACARGYTKTARGKHQHQPHARTHTYAAQQQEALEYPPIKSHWKLQWVSEHHHKRSAREAGDRGRETGGRDGGRGGGGCRWSPSLRVVGPRGWGGGRQAPRCRNTPAPAPAARQARGPVLAVLAGPGHGKQVGGGGGGHEAIHLLRAGHATLSQGGQPSTRGGG